MPVLGMFEVLVRLVFCSGEEMVWFGFGGLGLDAGFAWFWVSFGCWFCRGFGCGRGGGLQRLGPV